MEWSAEVLKNKLTEYYYENKERVCESFFNYTYFNEPSMVYQGTLVGAIAKCLFPKDSNKVEASKILSKDLDMRKMVKDFEKIYKPWYEVRVKDEVDKQKKQALEILNRETK